MNYKYIDKRMMDELMPFFDWAFENKMAPYSDECASMSKGDFINKAFQLADRILDEDYHHGLCVIFNWRKPYLQQLFNAQK